MSRFIFQLELNFALMDANVHSGHLMVAEWTNIMNGLRVKNATCPISPVAPG